MRHPAIGFRAGEREIGGPAMERRGFSQPPPPRRLLIGADIPRIAAHAN